MLEVPLPLPSHLSPPPLHRRGASKGPWAGSSGNLNQEAYKGGQLPSPPLCTAWGDVPDEHSLRRLGPPQHFGNPHPFSSPLQAPQLPACKSTGSPSWVLDRALISVRLLEVREGQCLLCWPPLVLLSDGEGKDQLSLMSVGIGQRESSRVGDWGTQVGLQQMPAFHGSLWSLGCGWAGSGRSQAVAFLLERRRERREADTLGSNKRRQAVCAVTSVRGGWVVLSGKGIDWILRKAIARASC